MKRHWIIGLIAAALLVGFYLGILSLSQGWSHALEQTGDLWYWVVALAVGFGVQAGLYSFLRQGIKKLRAAPTASVAASGGVSTTSMAACCAHHLSDVLPALGLSGVASFLAGYQTIFILAGVLSNLVGITIMLEAIQRHGFSPRVAALNWDLRRVKIGVMVLASITMVVVVLTQLASQGLG